MFKPLPTPTTLDEALVQLDLIRPVYEAAVGVQYLTAPLSDLADALFTAEKKRIELEQRPAAH